MKVIPEPRPLHDPTDEFAIVLYDPSVDGEMIIQDDTETVQNVQSSEDQNAQEAEAEKSKYKHPKILSNGVKNKTLQELLGNSPFNPTESMKKKFANVPVVIDPKLAKILRPHQVEGVKFLYRCVTGLVMKDFLDQQLASQSSNINFLECSDDDVCSKEVSPLMAVEPMTIVKRIMMRQVTLYRTLKER